MFKTIARAVAVTVVPLLALAGVSAASASVTHVKPAITGSCGPTCLEPIALTPGPQWPLTDHLGSQAIGTKQYLNYLSVTNPRQDYAPDEQGPVVATFCPHSGAIDPILSANACAYLTLHGEAANPAYELQYTPLGVDSGLCPGVAGHAYSYEAVTLRECGVNASTLWILDSFHSVGPFQPVINGSTTNFSYPQVLTAANGAPAQQLVETRRLSVDTAGIVAGTQLWAFLPGL